MNLLLDTNVLIWWAEDNPRIFSEAGEAIRNPDNIAYVSVASAWEIAIKSGLGKLRGRTAAASGWVPDAIAGASFELLPVALAHALGVERLPRHHNDPFDRILIAQALAEGMHLVTGDAIFERYSVPVIRL